MKMPAAAFADLRHLFEINNLLDPSCSVAESYRARKLTPMRYRWDRFWAIPFSERNNWFDDHMIYSSMDDTHIDTALRHLFPATWSQ